jgi:DNA invertase Pin-like site-specific DNA recombinase
LAEFARLERETLITRIKSGLEKAKKNGVTLGRKKGSVISNDMLLKKYRGVVKDLEHNISLRKIARIHSVSLCTILKVKKAMGV